LQPSIHSIKLSVTAIVLISFDPAMLVLSIC